MIIGILGSGGENIQFVIILVNQKKLKKFSVFLVMLELKILQKILR